MNKDDIAWIGVDWGTTNLRCWAVDYDGHVLDSRQTGDGILSVQEDFESVFLQIAGDFLSPNRKTPVFACGMIGSRQGWVETSYQSAPCCPVPNVVRVPSNDPRFDFHITKGICQLDPPDVMRGEETQIAGFVADRNEHTGWVCLPGTHTKWVFLEKGLIREFQTYMTGETFSLFTTKSILRHSVSLDGWDHAAFTEGVTTSLRDPVSISAQLFSIRANDLLNESNHAAARSRLSGFLLGSEVASQKAKLEGEISIIGEGTIAKLYGDSLKAAGFNAVLFDPTQMTIKGLNQIQNTMKNPR